MRARNAMPRRYMALQALNVPVISHAWLTRGHDLRGVAVAAVVR